MTTPIPVQKKQLSTGQIIAIVIGGALLMAGMISSGDVQTKHDISCSSLGRQKDLTQTSISVYLKECR